MRKSSIFLLTTLLLVSCASTRKIEVRETSSELKNIDRDLRRLLDCWFIRQSEVCFRNNIDSNSPMARDEDHFRNAFRDVLSGDPGQSYRLDGPQVKGWFKDVDKEELKKLKEDFYNFESIEEDGYLIASSSDPDWPLADENDHFRLNELKDERVVFITFIAYGDGIQSGVFNLIMVRKSYSWLLWEYVWTD